MTARFGELGFVVFSAPKAQKLLPDEGSYFPLIRPLAGAPSPQGEGLEQSDILKFEDHFRMKPRVIWNILPPSTASLTFAAKEEVQTASERFSSVVSSLKMELSRQFSSLA